VSREVKISPRDLRFGKLFNTFHKHLRPVLAQPEHEGTGLDRPHPRRDLDSFKYLTLWLLAMTNPVITSMRGLCQVSQLKEVEDKTGAGPVSLGSFSEAQNVLDLAILPKVAESLLQALPEQAGGLDLPCSPKNLILVDSSLWPAVERMGWANWRHQHKSQKAVRLHVQFQVLKGQPEAIETQEGRGCERAYLRENLQPDYFYVADRNYGRDHGLLNQMLDLGCHFIIRGLEGIKPSEVLQEHSLEQADQDAGILSDQQVLLGQRAQYRTHPLRRIEMVIDSGEKLVLLTDQSPQEMSAAMVAAVYKARWRIELYFKWIKSILKNRHFLAESPQGVAIQMYMALIAAILLQALTGRRPNKRQMEMIQLYLMGWVSEQELDEWLEKLTKQGASKNS
jgi:hypothetical protein